MCFIPKFALANTLSLLIIDSTGTEVKPFTFAIYFAHNTPVSKLQTTSSCRLLNAFAFAASFAKLIPTAPVSKLQTTSSCRLLNASHPPGAPVFSSTLSLLPSTNTSDAPSYAKFGLISTNSFEKSSSLSILSSSARVRLASRRSGASSGLGAVKL